MEQPANPTKSLSSSSREREKGTNSRTTNQNQNQKQKRKLPTAQELIAHYESQGLETKEASVKVIEDLQKALFRVVTSSSSSKGGSKDDDKKFMAETSRKLDVINTRLVNLHMKVDSKPGYGETLAIVVASGAVLRGIGSVFPHVVRSVGQIWNAVRSSSSSDTPTSH